MLLGRRVVGIRRYAPPGAANRSRCSPLSTSTSKLTHGARRLPPELLAGGGSAFTAHPRRDAATGRLVAFSYTMQPRVGGLGGDL
jgi:hypothetical protein